MVESSESRSIVVVDDEEPMRDYLYEVLTREGHQCQCFEESLAALSHLSGPDSSPDLLLTDINMPGMGGMDLLRTVRAVTPDLPVILISGLYELGLAIDALKLGAADYLLKPAKPADIVKLVAKYLEPLTQSQHALARAVLQRFMSARDPNQPVTDQVHEVFHALGFKRYETLQHSKRVAGYALLFGKHCGLNEEQLRHLELGALLHDIGKIAIPHNVLLKNGPLDSSEWDAMRMHTRIGAELLEEFPELAAETDVVRSHHERFEGGGYPAGAKGDAIPLLARIFSVVDTFDAITSDRPYREGRSIEVAKELIERESGTQFDPRLVEIFLKLPEEHLEEIRRQYPDADPES